MKIAITGANGFIGTTIQNQLYKGRAEYQVLNRNASDDVWMEIIKEAYVVINLAGAPVIQRWTKRKKKLIVDSRVNTTRRLVKILNEMPQDIYPKLLISASAIGIYPDTGSTGHTEDSLDYGHTFLSEVVKLWENEARKLEHPAIRLVIPRIGVVLGNNGGLLKKILPLFKLGLGGKIGSGKQVLSFIHVDDLLEAFQFFIDSESAKGVYNLVAPNVTTNLQFTKFLGNILSRPVLFDVPSFVLKIIYGKAAQIMINGEWVIPQKLVVEGFVFKYPKIGIALKSIFAKKV